MGQGARDIDRSFMEALASHEWGAAERALAQGADIERAASPKGSPLREACMFGDALAVVFLMDRGAAGEAGTAGHPNRSTPLHLAAGCSPLSVAAILARSPEMARAWILSRDERAELGLCAQAKRARPAPRA